MERVPSRHQRAASAPILVDGLDLARRRGTYVPRPEIQHIPTTSSQFGSRQSDGANDWPSSHEAAPADTPSLHPRLQRYQPSEVLMRAMQRQMIERPARIDQRRQDKSRTLRSRVNHPQGGPVLREQADPIGHLTVGIDDIRLHSDRAEIDVGYEFDGHLEAIQHNAGRLRVTEIDPLLPIIRNRRGQSTTDHITSHAHPARSPTRTTFLPTRRTTVSPPACTTRSTRSRRTIYPIATASRNGIHRAGTSAVRSRRECRSSERASRQMQMDHRMR